MSWKEEILAGLTWGINKLVQLFRRFDVFISAECNTLKAGERTKLCTISVDLGNGEWDGIQENLPFVTHSSNDQVLRSQDKIDVQPWKRNSAGQLERTIYVTATKAGEDRNITFTFRDDNIRLNGGAGAGLSYCMNDRLTFSCRYSVVPAGPAVVKVKKVLGDHEDKTVVYCGGTATIFVENLDEYGNITNAENNSSFNAFKLISAEPVNSIQFVSAKANSFKVKCLTSGSVQANVECILGHANRRLYINVPLKIKQPPSSSKYSRVVPEDLKEYADKTFEAGTEITFRVCVKDIYGNPLRQIERKVEINAVLKNIGGKSGYINGDCARNTFVVEGEDDSDLYYVRMILKSSGIWELIVFVDGNCLLTQELPFVFTVVPTKLEKVQGKIEGRHSVCINTPQILVIETIDEFGNVIPYTNSTQFEVFSNIRSLRKDIDLVFEADDGRARCFVKFVSVGQHCVKLLLREPKTGKTFADSFNVHVRFNYNFIYLGNERNLEAYNDENHCNLSFNPNSFKHYTITCNEISKSEIIGPDHSRLHNINRVLGSEVLTDDQITEEIIQGETVISIKSLSEKEATKIHGLIVAYLRGRHYRLEASAFAELRDKYRLKSEQAYEEGYGYNVRVYNKKKEDYRKCMSLCNQMARDEIFEMYNDGREMEEIDLHELYVANETRLTELCNDLKKRYDLSRAMEIVNKVRKDQDEAIEKLRERLQQIDSETKPPRWLEVIVGAGHHSKGKQKIKPKVQDFLKEEQKRRNLPDIEQINEGSLLITFEPYSGPEPCTGFYYCKKCKKSWCSQNSWVGKYQCCHRCNRRNVLSKCYPMKQGAFKRERSKKNDFTGCADHHYPELCQRCQELGRNCITMHAK